MTLTLWDLAWDRSFEDWETKFRLEIVKHDTQDVPSSLWKIWTDSTLQFMADFRYMHPGMKEEKEEFSKAFTEAVKECSEGVGIVTTRRFEIVARKL